MPLAHAPRHNKAKLEQPHILELTSNIHEICLAQHKAAANICMYKNYIPAALSCSILCIRIFPHDRSLDMTSSRPDEEIIYARIILRIMGSTKNWE